MQMHTQQVGFFASLSQSPLHHDCVPRHAYVTPVSTRTRILLTWNTDTHTRIPIIWSQTFGFRCS